MIMCGRVGIYHVLLKELDLLQYLDILAGKVSGLNVE